MRIASILLSFVLLAGCKKDPVPTIEGKWDLDKVVEEEYYDGKLVFAGEQDKTGESIEFRSDGQVVVIDQSGTRTAPYTISADTISFLSISYLVQNLEENSVILLDHHVHGVGEYHDTWLHLKR